MFFDLCAPCALCARPCENSLCRHCRAQLDTDLTLPAPRCRCGLPAPGVTTGALCGRCLTHPPPFAAVHAARRYAFPLDRLINAYKHRGRLDLERALLTLAEPAPGPWPQADLLCPVPAHWRRRLTRGFDQAERLAVALAQRWQTPVAPLLWRRHATPRQQGLGRARRARNLRQAFIAAPATRGRRVLLIDDVVTTTSSARAATQALLEAGAREVRVWALARALDGR